MWARRGGGESPKTEVQLGRETADGRSWRQITGESEDVFYVLLPTTCEENSGIEFNISFLRTPRRVENVAKPLRVPT